MKLLNLYGMFQMKQLSDFKNLDRKFFDLPEANRLHQDSRARFSWGIRQ